MNADFTRERLEFHKQLIDAHAQRDSAHEQLYDLGETVKLYQEQYAELEKNMKQGGASKKEVRPGQWTSSFYTVIHLLVVDVSCVLFWDHAH